jgi:hypothetical protein
MHPPAILLLGKQDSTNSFVRIWFEKSRFWTVETTDIFRVLEEISDFTVARRPDVILLEETSFQSDLSTINDFVQNSLPESNLPLFALLKSGNFINLDASFEGNLRQLEAELDKIIPQPESSIRAAV